MRGRKPTPTHLKILAGNPGKQKLPKGEPQPPPDMPEPPGHLDAYALEEWNRLAAGLNAMGILTAIDAGPFAAYCDSYSTWRRATEVFNEQKAEVGPMAATIIDGKINPILKIGSQAAAGILKYGAEFGLTPSSRARLAIDPGRGKSKFEGLINHHRKDK